MSAVPSWLTRAAANSIARGIPSSLRQMARTSAWLFSVSWKSVLTARARETKSSTAAESVSSSERDGTRKVCSPSICNDSRLVARIEIDRHAPRMRSTTSAHASMRCSQLSSTISVLRSDK
jgi:hypothetical protein